MQILFLVGVRCWVQGKICNELITVLTDTTGRLVKLFTTGIEAAKQKLEHQNLYEYELNVPLNAVCTSKTDLVVIVVSLWMGMIGVKMNKELKFISKSLEAREEVIYFTGIFTI